VLQLNPGFRRLPYRVPRQARQAGRQRPPAWSLLVWVLLAALAFLAVLAAPAKAWDRTTYERREITITIRPPWSPSGAERIHLRPAPAYCGGELGVFSSYAEDPGAPIAALSSS
jgi:hypothetical protein